jgi:hypothetical protein
VGIKVNTAKLREATKDLAGTITPVVEATRDLVDQNTDLPGDAWGVIGSMVVSSHYKVARDYQARQLQDNAKCLHGMNAGLYSVALHYDNVELENAKRAYAAIDGYWNPRDKAAALAKVNKLKKRIPKDSSDLRMAHSNDDSYHQ